MAKTEQFDLIIRNATVIDGTKAPRFRGRHRRARRQDRGDRQRSIRRSADVEIDAIGPHRRARLHRRAHARRPAAAVRPRRDAQGEPGRHHRDHRQLRHQPRALARAAGRAHAAARSARHRRRLVPVPELPRLPRDARSAARRDQRGVSRRAHDVSRRDDGPARPRGHRRRDREDARDGARIARVGRDRRFHRHRLSAGRVRDAPRRSSRCAAR